LALVTKSELYAFFRELAKPFDPDQRPVSPTPEAMQELFEIAARHKYWMATKGERGHRHQPISLGGMKKGGTK
jgi:hypothetical protein